MPVQMTHAQYIKSSKEILNDSGFIEDYQPLAAVTDELIWLGEFDNGFNATIDLLDAAIKTSVPMRSISGNLTSGVLATATAVDNADGFRVWSQPGNVYTSGASYATATIDAAERQTNFLKCTNFGFSIPTDATITDVYAYVRGYTSKSGNASFSGKIVKGGVIGGTQVGAGVLTSISPTTNLSERYCGTAVNDGASEPWSDPTFAEGAPDGPAATLTVSTESDYLKCTNYNFGGVNAGDIITNLAIGIDTWVQSGQSYDIYLVLAGVIQSTKIGTITPTGSQQTYTFNYDTKRDLLGSDILLSTFGVAIKATNAGGATIDSVGLTVTRGVANDALPTVQIGSGLWGNTLTPADVNASNFGIALQESNSSGANDINFDYVTMEIKYHQAASNEYTTTIKIDPQGLGWETLTSFTDSYVIGGTTTTHTHQQSLKKLAAFLANAKAPFKVGLFLTVPGEIDIKDVSMDGTYFMIYGASE